MARRAAAAAAAVLLAGTFRDASGCSIVAVGRDASATGHPIVTHTDDGGASNDFRLVRVPRKKWPKGSRRNIYQWQDMYPRVVTSNFMTADYYPEPGQMESTPVGSIPQVEETWAYWDVDYGMMNEWGLSIGESTGNAKTAGWVKSDSNSYGKNMFGIEDLSKIALERCKTAKCAVETMGQLAVEYGFYSEDSGDPAKPDLADSAEILVLADLDDVWIFNVMTGKNQQSAIWGAHRIPPDHVAVIADSFSFSLDLTDPENNMWSPGVTELAEEMGWRKYDKEKPGHFDFFLAYGAEIEEPQKTVMGYYVSRRIWRGYTMLAPEEGANLNPNQTHLANGGRLPTSVKARPGSVSLEMVFKVHRDHYEGTPFDLTKGMAAGPWGNPNRQDMAPPGQWERAFSLTRTVMSYVLSPRPNGRSVAWFSYDAPHGSVYLPFYAAATESPPDSFHSRKATMSAYNKDAAWWAFNLVNTFSNLNFQLINGEVQNRCKEKEAEAMSLMKLWEAEADQAEHPMADVQINPAVGRESGLNILTQRSNEFVEATVNEWWNLLEHLFSKYSRAAVDYADGDEGRQVYPEWWLDSPEVGFRTWTPEGPYHGVECKVGKPCGVDQAADVQFAAVSPAEDTRINPFMLQVAAVAALPLSVSLSAVSYFLGVRRGRHEASEGRGYVFLTA